MDTSKEIHKHLTANSHIKKKYIIVGNFLGGIAWGVGTVIGATVVVAILFSILRSFNFLPFVGDFLRDLPEKPSNSLQLQK
ncbi:hypothetical protein HYW42_04745 [Candidatus Daviesbacteria bacterium]|nr:hypothetical protein [Candidatus Daviesbacteria bacterium]